jgi:cytidylate kinase
MKKWILVTGGVMSGVGKGCLSAVLCRAINKQGINVAYRKIEPCLQGDLEYISNDQFGEIVLGENQTYYDADTARVGFFVGENADISDQSLGHALYKYNDLHRVANVAAPRMIESIASGLTLNCLDECIMLVEVGGTSGEIEHRFTIDALLHELGKPILHLHVTTYALINGRVTSKPAEISMRALSIFPDVIFMRSEHPIETPIPFKNVIIVDQDQWVERAWHKSIKLIPTEVLHKIGLNEIQKDPIFSFENAAKIPIRLISDVTHPDAYASLITRINTWSQGQILILNKKDALPAIAEIRIGEKSPPTINATIKLEIVPTEIGKSPRDRNVRYDWHGTADQPSGKLHEFIKKVLETKDFPDLEQGYIDEAFAEIYCAKSMQGKLKDHILIDPVIESALPKGERLKNFRILDVGCGWGRWAKKLTDQGAFVVGVEPSKAMAIKSYDLNMKNFEIHNTSLFDAQITGTFDLILACMSLDHEPELDKTLYYLKKRINPRGRLIISTEHPILTATKLGGRWTEDRSVRVKDYLDIGARDYSWFDRGERIRVYHRTFEDWITSLNHVGFKIVSVKEPGNLQIDHAIPRFWTIVAERLGTPTNLITIDGTAGSGKTTIARKLSKVLGWHLLDTGELRRAMIIRNQRDISRKSKIQFIDDIWYINEIALSDKELREAPLSETSLIPTEIEERTFIETALKQPLIMVGRSLGRYYDAALRLYLDCDIEIRAKRHSVSIQSLQQRDIVDRENQRLLPPDIATIILDGSKPIDDLIEHITQLSNDLF